MEASGVDEALNLTSSGLLPDVLFTDVRMPGSRDGLDLARELSAQLPLLLVFVASGDADPKAAMRYAHRFIAKPYDLEQVVRSVIEALGNP